MPSTAYLLCTGTTKLLHLTHPMSLRRDLPYMEFSPPQAGRQVLHSTSSEKHWKPRQTLVRIGMTKTVALVLQIIPDNASAKTEVSEGFRLHTDDVNNFKVMIPKEWQVGVGESNGFKSITAFYPRENFGSNGLGLDFYKDITFGKVDESIETMVSGLDISWQRPSGVAAKLLKSKASKELDTYLLYFLTELLKNFNFRIIKLVNLVTILS
ncbi:hypothetical protein UlMin_008300 [Ulmus minor]